MANELPPQNLETTEEEEEEEELLKLKQMAQTIRRYRSTIPDLFKNTLSSLLTAQRPILFPPSTSQPGIPDAGYSAESSEGPLAEEDHEIAAKVTLLNHKISSNISAMPSALKRMNDCNSMMEKLDTYNVNIHPAFKRKRTR